MIEIAFRTNDASTPWPQPPKLPEPQVKGFTQAAPWQCPPFVDGYTLGIELRWPWNYSLTIKHREDGEVFCWRHPYGGSPGPLSPADISLFAKGHYGVNSHHQLLLPTGWDGLVLPHPSTYDSPRPSMPDIVPGVIHCDTWPACFFIVSGLPAKGKSHCFEAGQPFCRVVPVPRQEVVVRQMTDNEKTTWSEREAFVEKHRYDIATHVWTDDKGQRFDNRYSVLPKELKRLGWGGVLAKYSRENQ